MLILVNHNRKVTLNMIVLSLGFILLVLFPNLPLAVEQIHRYYIGIDEVSKIDHPLVSATAIYMMKKGYSSPEQYAEEQIIYADDFEIWGNADYYESPEQVIRLGRSDCDGKAILVKALYRKLIELNISAKEEEVDIQKQFGHWYVKVEWDELVNDSTNTTITKTPYKINHATIFDHYYRPTKFFWDIIPDIRKILLGIGLSIIWISGYRKLEDEDKNETKTKKTKTGHK